MNSIYTIHFFSCPEDQPPQGMPMGKVVFFYFKNKWISPRRWEIPTCYDLKTTGWIHEISRMALIPFVSLFIFCNIQR